MGCTSPLLSALRTRGSTASAGTPSVTSLGLVPVAHRRAAGS